MSYKGLEKLTYTEYLESTTWREIRSHALWKADYQCELCGNRHELQVHHKHYPPRGEETASDLVVLCKWCHEAMNGRLPGDLN